MASSEIRVHGASLATAFWDQVSRGENTDISIRFDDGCKINAHKPVIAAHHSGWKSLLQSIQPYEEDVVVIAPGFSSDDVIDEIQTIYFNNLSTGLTDREMYPFLNSVGSPEFPVKKVVQKSVMYSLASGKKVLGKGGKPLGLKLSALSKKIPWVSKAKKQQKGGMRLMVNEMNEIVEEIVLDKSGKVVSTVDNNAKGGGVQSLALHRCLNCDLVFGDLKSLENHRIAIHDERFKCKHCPKETSGFGSSENLKAHLLSKHFEREYLCKLCGDVSPTFEYHERHLRQHIRTDPVSGLAYCPFCNKEISSMRNLTGHLLIHIDPQYYKYQCSYCDQKFYSITKQNEHENVAHTGALTYVCPICGRGFCTSARRAVHKKKCDGSGLVKARGGQGKNNKKNNKLDKSSESEDAEQKPMVEVLVISDDVK